MQKINSRRLQDLEVQNDGKRESHGNFQNTLGVDFGEKFCGLAFSPDGICVLPLAVIPTKDLENKIRQIVTEKHIRKIIFGLPFLPDGKENRICPIIRKFAGKFESLATIGFVNERFSSKTVYGKGEERIDDLAAIRILEFAFAKT